MLTQVNSVQYLGVLIDSVLSWTLHVRSRSLESDLDLLQAFSCSLWVIATCSAVCTIATQLL